jgi:hypothetical protein
MLTGDSQRSLIQSNVRKSQERISSFKLQASTPNLLSPVHVVLSAQLQSNRSSASDDDGAPPLGFAGAFPKPPIPPNDPELAGAPIPLPNSAACVFSFCRACMLFPAPVPPTGVLGFAEPSDIVHRSSKPPPLDFAAGAGAGRIAALPRGAPPFIGVRTPPIEGAAGAMGLIMLIPP